MSNSTKGDILILFLDIDGVLNTPKDITKMYTINPELLENLKKFVEMYKAKVVISSTWRIIKDKEFFEEALGVPLHEDWKTRKLDGIRGFEVRDWLERNIPADQYWSFRDYLILDDDSDFLYHQPLCKINYNSGFDNFHFQKASTVYSFHKTGIDPYNYILDNQ